MGKHVNLKRETVVTNAATRADAWNRAARTLWQGFGVDVCVAVGLGLAVLLETGDVMSPLFWGTLGVLIVKSVLTSAASYLTRLRVAPKSE